MTEPLKFFSRRRFTVLGVVLLLALVGFASCNLSKQRRDPRLAAIRQAGYPVTLAELDNWYPRVPDAENAALIYTNAFARMVYTESNAEQQAFAARYGLNMNNVRRQISDIQLPPRGEMLTGEDKTELAEMIASNAPALRLLYSARTLTNSRYPIDLKLGLAVWLPHLSEVRGAVVLLSAESALHAANQEPEKAFDSLEAATHVASSLNSEPLLISQLVRFASWAVIVSKLEHVLNATKFSEAELATLQNALADAEQLPAASRALAGERASILAIFDDPKMRQFLFSNGSTSNSSFGTTVKAGLVRSVLQLSGLFAKDRNYSLETMTTNIAAASLPYPARLNASRQVSSAYGAIPNRFYIYSGMLLPALAKFHIRDAEHTARVRVGQTALAIERYRLAHGNALPASLDELVPAYLTAVPGDPCDGEKLRFKRLEKGYIVYSIGSDLKDDGGQERKSGGGQANYDVTFIIVN